MTLKRRPHVRAAAGVLAALLLALAGCGVGSEPSAPPEITGLEQHQATFLELFDTLTYVVGYSETVDEFSAAVSVFHDEMLEYHQLYDIYNEYDGMNNLKTVNDSAGGEPVEVDQRIIDLLLFCREMYEATEGRTNVMMGSVLRLWHNAREYSINNPAEAYLPDEAELRAANEHTAFDALVIDDEANTVQITDPEASLDVGAVAKGYAVQRVCENCLPDGYTVSVGGNVCSMSTKPNGADWIAGIQSPNGEASDYLARVHIGANSIVSSGSYQRRFTVDGVSYGHIIDPSTLYPPTYWADVTIIYPDSGIADALSTALFTLDRESGEALLEKFPGAEALWAGTDGSVEYTPGFEDYIYDTSD